MPRGTLTAGGACRASSSPAVSRPPHSSAPRCTCRICSWNAMPSPRLCGPHAHRRRHRLGRGLGRPRQAWDPLEHRKAVRIGSALVLGAVVLALVTTVLAWPAAVAIAGSDLAGGGMGLMYPRLSVMTLALSTKDTEGFNSSAMSISDSLGGALALAGTGIVFAAFSTTTAASFAGVFALTAVIGVAAVAVAPRVADRPGRRRRARNGLAPRRIAAQVGSLRRSLDAGALHRSPRTGITASRSPGRKFRPGLHTGCSCRCSVDGRSADRARLPPRGRPAIPQSAPAAAVSSG